MSHFEPKIVGFLCNWCCAGKADWSGISRVRHPRNLRLVRVMCSGRVEPTSVLEALANGADGVFVGACQPGDCHYQEGNYNTMRRFALLKRLLGQFGVEPERVRVEWLSSGDEERASKLVADMTEQMKKLGPFVAQASSLQVCNAGFQSHDISQ